MGRHCVRCSGERYKAIVAEVSQHGQRSVGSVPPMAGQSSSVGGGRNQDRTVLLMFESLLARDECCHAAFGMNVFTVALEAAIRAVRIDRPCIVSLYR